MTSNRAAPPLIAQPLMTGVIHSATAPAKSANPRSARLRALGSACLAHVVHDGYSDLLYLLFPLWQREFALSLAQVGAMKTVFSGALSLFQIPAARLAERFGDRTILAAGTFLAGSSVLLYGSAGAIPVLFGILFLAGLGAAVQHPLSSAIVARAYENGGARAALATYNFAGDAGKVLLPAAATLIILIAGWRTAVLALGAAGIAIAAGLFFLIPASLPQAGKAAAHEALQASRREGQSRSGFMILTLIGVVDNATRTGFLTFLPLLLSAKGAGAASIGTALTLIFAGGAVGKFACGVLAERAGIIRTVAITEIATALLIGGLLAAPVTVIFFLMLPLGVALNGTSSVLYGSVAELAPPAQRARAFAFFYTVTLGAGALAPLFYGLIGDRIGIVHTLMLVAVGVLAVLPLAWRLARYIGPARAEAAG